jgi:hypothetical protein
MTTKDWLEVVANISSIITAIVAVSAWTYYKWQLRRKRRDLEGHLEKAQHEPLGKSKQIKPQRGLVSISAALGLSQAEILQAAFDSHVIQRRVKTDDEGFAREVLLEYGSK